MENTRNELSKLRKIIYQSKTKKFSITSNPITNNFSINKNKNEINNNMKFNKFSKKQNEIKDNIDIDKNLVKKKKNFAKDGTGFVKTLDEKEMTSKEDLSRNKIKYFNNDKKTYIHLNSGNHLNAVSEVEKNINQKDENQKKCNLNNYKKIQKRFNDINKKQNYINEYRSYKFKTIQFNDSDTDNNKKIKFKHLQPNQKKTEKRNLKHVTTYNTLNINNVENRISLNAGKQENTYKKIFKKINNTIINNELNNSKFKTIVNCKKYHFNSSNKMKNENSQVSKNMRNNKIKSFNNDIEFFNSFNIINKTANNLYDANKNKYKKCTEKSKNLNKTENNFKKISNVNSRNYIKTTKLIKNKMNSEARNNYIANFADAFEDTINNKSNQYNIRNKETIDNTTQINAYASINSTKRSFNINIESLKNLNKQKTLTKSEKIDKKALKLNRLNNQKLKKFSIEIKNNELEKTFTAKATKKLKKIYSKPLTHKLSLLYFSSNIIKANNSIININERCSQKYLNESSSNSIVIRNINNIKELLNNDNFKYSKRNITPKAFSGINSNKKNRFINLNSKKTTISKVINIKPCFVNKLYNYYISKFNITVCYITKNYKNVKIYGEKRNNICFLPHNKLCYFSKNSFVKKNYKSEKIIARKITNISIENDNSSKKINSENIKIINSQESNEKLEMNFEHKSDNLSTIVNINNTFSLLSYNDSLIKNETQDKIDLKNITKNIQTQDELIPFSGDAYLFSLFKDDFLLESNSDKVVTEGKLIPARNIKIYDMEDLEKGLIIFEKYIKKEVSKICFRYFKRYKNITDIKKIAENKKYNEIMKRNFVEFTLNNIGNYCRFTKDFVNKNSNLYLPVNVKQENNNIKFITPTKKSNKKIFFSPHFKIIKNKNLESTQENYTNHLNFCTETKSNKEINNIRIKVNYKYYNCFDKDNIKKKIDPSKLSKKDKSLFIRKLNDEEKKEFSYEEIILYNQNNCSYCHSNNFLPKNIIEHCKKLQKIKKIEISDEKNNEKEILFLLNIITENNFYIIMKEIIKIIILDINLQYTFLKLIINRITKEKIYLKVYAKCCYYVNKKIQNNNDEKKQFGFDKEYSFINNIKSELLKKYNLIIKCLKDKNDIINFINFIASLIELNVLLYDSFLYYLDKLYKDYFENNNNLLLLESIIQITFNININNIKDKNIIKNIIDFFENKIQPILKNVEIFPSYLKYNCINLIEKYSNDYLSNNSSDNKYENKYQYFSNHKIVNEVLYNIYINNDKEQNIKKLLLYDLQNYIKSKKDKIVNYNWFIIDEIIFNLHIEINTIIFYYIYVCQSAGSSDNDIKYSNEYFNEILNYFLQYSLENKYVNKILHEKIIDVFSEICSDNTKINTTNMKISYVFYLLLKTGIIKNDDFCYFSNKNEEIKRNFRNIINGVIALDKENEYHFLDSLRNF